ncbi:MBOAT family protein [Rariglobus hedericola]|uniref:MBOAT family protein n=1 Tax=Rariglobus hedericola TaxID=2597822 RepID=UPI001396B1CD|nr:MBOAT family protein [Rariglobus hedericola]
MNTNTDHGFAFWSVATILFTAVLLTLAVRIPIPWLCMWVVAGGEFFALKLVTTIGLCRSAPAWRLVAYLTLWPGMNARGFLFHESAAVRRPTLTELVFALVKMALGLAAIFWAVIYLKTAPRLLTGWVGMVGIIFTLHFGALHLVSWLWRRNGFDAPPIMKVPVLAVSLADFWGVRWNVAFADSARRFVLLPLARKWGTQTAGAFVFLLSGLVHETVISFPARGGWGGPTLYFVIQGVGAWLEKTSFARMLHLRKGIGGRIFTIVVVVIPLPLLFHPIFVREVILPLIKFLNTHFL